MLSVNDKRVGCKLTIQKGFLYRLQVKNILYNEIWRWFEIEV